MQSAFIVTDSSQKPYALLGLLSGGTEIYPLTEAAKDWASWMADEFAAKKITREELVATIDNSMDIEGPIANTRANKVRIEELIKKAKKPADPASDKVSEKSEQEFLSLSDAVLSDLSNDEWRNAVQFKAASFLSDMNKSTFAYEVKRTRAIWDPGLSIPGTERRGGWRCPVGTRYGGQITDRFGRNCGWGVARRLANAISDLGERLENVGDRRREGRVARRNERMVRRLREGGAIERGARAVARAAEAVDFNPENKPAARRRRGERRPGVIERAAGRAAEALNRGEGGGNLRPSEARRMEREIERPGAPRTPRAPQQRKPRQPRQPVKPQAKPNVKPDVEPDVKPSMRNTKPPAGAPRPNESLEAYKRRKYNEHQANVRKIREEGGNAGFLKYEEWDQFHGPLVEDNWNKAQGKGRAARRTASDAVAKPSATRRPKPADKPIDKQPPKKNPRKPFKAEHPRGYNDEIAAKRARIKMEREGVEGELQIVRHNDKFFVVKKDEVDRANANGANLDVVKEPPRPQGRPINPRREDAPVAPPAPPAAPPSPPKPPSSPSRGDVPDEYLPTNMRPKRQPRNTGQQDLAKADNAIEHLHKKGGKLEDVPDGVVIDAVVDDNLKGLPAGADRRAILNKGLARLGLNEGATFENDRYKFKFVKSGGAGTIWEVIRVQDKQTGEIWYMKTSQYGQNDALLENIGMRAAQALEFGNDENHLRIGEVLTGNGNGKPMRWMMMRDVAQWDNAVELAQGDKWKDAYKQQINPGDAIEPRDAARLAIMDYVFDNRDRHQKNFLMAKDAQGRIRLAVIDNGLFGGGRLKEQEPGQGVTPLELADYAKKEAGRKVAQYRQKFNNGIKGLVGAGFRHKNARDRDVFADQARRTIDRLEQQLDTIFSIDRIEANGVRLTDVEKAHIKALREVAEGRIALLRGTELDELIKVFN